MNSNLRVGILKQNIKSYYSGIPGFEWSGNLIMT
jgi:hypothetical protein